MLKHHFQPERSHAYVIYARMSSDRQNERSPEQQVDTIETVIRRLGYPWTAVETFIDRGISGQYLRKRTEFQRMLSAIRSRRLKVSYILVDTLERLGRADEIADIRRELATHYGVLVLTADTNFSDPTSVSGRAMAAFESLRSTEDGRIKAHNVFRGKKDAVRQGHWPGGRAPFGYKLESVFVERSGRKEVDHCNLVPDDSVSWIIKFAFASADEKGWRAVRIARALNEHPEIIDKSKPFHAATVNRWLAAPIYKGTLVWPQVATGVVNDTRVVERVAKEDQIVFENFCEPLVDPARWQRVQDLRRARQKRICSDHQHDGTSENGMRPLSPGLPLKYLLSGLVRCGDCGIRMTLSPSPTYVTKAGVIRRYASYSCPRYISGVCQNSRRVPEEWLRRVVIDLLTRRLFGLGD